MSFLVWGYVGGMQPCCAGICVDARLFAAMRGDNVCWRCGKNKMSLQIVKCWLKMKLGWFVDALKSKVLCSSPLLKTFLFCSRLTCSSVNPSLMKFLNSLRKYIRLLEEVIFLSTSVFKAHFTNKASSDKTLLNLCQIFSISPVALGVDHFTWSHFNSRFQLSPWLNLEIF